MMHSGLQMNVLTILGLFSFSHGQAASECDISHQPCVVNPGGVLDCFSRREVTGTRSWRCVWIGEDNTSLKSYSLIIQQESYCIRNENLIEESEKLQIYLNRNITAFLLDKNCTKAIFRGSPISLLRCGPPFKVWFSRRSGTVKVNVIWVPQEKKVIQGYTLRYRERGDLLWRESSLTAQSSLVGLNPDVSYEAEIKCDVNNKCSQCLWSQPYIIPPELRTQPVLTGLNESNTVTNGTRKVSLSWKIASKDRAEGFHVNISKASGELPREDLNTTDTTITLTLSCSSYTVNISAFNNVSVSPALTITIQWCDQMTDLEDGRLNVTVNGAVFTVYWRPYVLNDYVCFSVEWTEREEKTAYMSFYENKNNSKILQFTEPLEPYKKYSLYLHTRPNKNTCNIKHINNGERTYGRTHFYNREGAPISAPSNISCVNVSSSSVVLQWSPIPDDHTRGFLQGYIIYYREHNRGGNAKEKNVTVDAALTSCVLEELRSGTGFQVQICGFTRGGTGVRSIATFFKTYEQDNWTDQVTIIIVVASSVMLIAASPFLKRTKVILWPNIPNPENSSAIQKIEKFESELIKTMTVEEWDSNTLQIIEEAVALRSLVVFTSEEENGDSNSEPELTQDVLDNHEQREPADSQPAFNCGYTTMEMFQQSLVPTKDTEETKIEVEDLVETKPGLEYIGQFCSSPTFDMSTL